jgi:hypothetical protein
MQKTKDQMDKEMEERYFELLEKYGKAEALKMIMMEAVANSFSSVRNVWSDAFLPRRPVSQPTVKTPTHPAPERLQ